MFRILPALVIGFCSLERAVAYPPFLQGQEQFILKSDPDEGFGASGVPSETMNIPLDHTAPTPTASTFPNRYFVKSDWYEKGGPVFLYDGGEGAADDRFISNSKDRDYDQLSFFEKFLKDHKGLGIVWEHRYYGESLPPGVNLNASREVDFQYLTTSQALTDVVYFANHFSRSGERFKGVDLTPKKTPWIFVGCSYPGSRAALMRVAHPDIIFASYASSAPVQATVDMHSYYEPIWSGLVANGHANCAADMHEAIIAIDNRLKASPTEATKIKQFFFGCVGQSMTDGQFAHWLVSIWRSWQYYGTGPNAGENQPGLKSLCDYISYDPKSGKYSDSRGWAKVHPDGVDFTLGRLVSWPGFNNQTFFQGDRSPCATPPPPPKPSCAKSGEVDVISWAYQYCTEWGYFQVANKGSSQIVSEHFDVEYNRQRCLCQFEESKVGSRTIPNTPKADQLNDQYGGWNMRPSRTFWTVGEFDPWRPLSPLKTDNHNIPECEASTAPGSPLFGHVLKNNQHCADFDNANSEAVIAHKLFSDALVKWLCCFVSKHEGDGNLNDGAKTALCPKGNKSA